jgi:hypothetical protein
MSCREYFVHDGQGVIGHFVVDEETGKAKAFNAAGRSIGDLKGYDAVRRAVNEAFRATAEALKQLNEPVGFASGLPADGRRHR